jgi:AbrB family looped-hinge helix DNA binding protein
MKTEIDRFGRIVIPKKLRDDLGLTTGTAVEIEERHEEVVIRAVRPGSPLKRKKGFLIFGGASMRPTANPVREDREARMRKLRSPAR